MTLIPVGLSRIISITANPYNPLRFQTQAPHLRPFQAPAKAAVLRAIHGWDGINPQDSGLSTAMPD
jgi:hypothetical protein